MVLRINLIKALETWLIVQENETLGKLRAQSTVALFFRLDPRLGVECLLMRVI